MIDDQDKDETWETLVLKFCFLYYTDNDVVFTMGQPKNKEVDKAWILK